MNLDWTNWLNGLFAGVFSAIGNSLIVGGLLVATDPDHVFTYKFWVPILGMLIVSVVKDMGLYLQQNKLPPILKTTEETTKIKGMPVKTVTTIEETKQGEIPK